MASANDKLENFFGTSGYYKYLLGFKLTDGVKALAENFKCFWFIDIIASYEPPSGHDPEDLQFWKLIKKPDSSAKVILTDGNKNIIFQQNILSTDFSEDEASVWVQSKIMLLPSEY